MAGKDNKTVTRYRRKLLKLAQENKDLDYKLTFLEAENEILTKRIEGFSVDEKEEHQEVLKKNKFDIEKIEDDR